MGNNEMGPEEDAVERPRASPGTVVVRIVLSLIALAVVMLVARGAPFLHSGTPVEAALPEPEEARTRSSRSGPMDVLLGGLPLQSQAVSIDDCWAQLRDLRSKASCDGCRVLMDELDTSAPVIAWMEPATPNLPDEAPVAWTIAAEVLVCDEPSGQGSRVSYRTEPGRDGAALAGRARSVLERFPLPMLPGARELMSVLHADWKLFVDEGVSFERGLAEASERLVSENWVPFEEPATEDGTPYTASRAFFRGADVCVLSFQRESDTTYLVSLYRRGA